MMAKSYSDAAQSASRFAPFTIVLLVLVFLLANSFVIVQPGHVGVLVTLGAVGSESLEEGFHMKKPFTGIQEMRKQGGTASS